jgi:hypothetical protein
MSAISVRQDKAKERSEEAELGKINLLMLIAEGRVSRYNPLKNKDIRELIEEGRAEHIIPYSSLWEELNSVERDPDIIITPEGKKSIIEAKRRKDSK